MEKILIILLFLRGVLPLGPSIPRKFYLFKQWKSWPEAQTYCRSKYTDLATIRNDADMIQIQTLAQNNNFGYLAWIGLYNKINSWRWSLGNETLGTMTMWGLLSPNNIGGNKECGSISELKFWDDYSCTSRLPFMCYDESYNDTNRYIFYGDLKTWHEAQTYCREKHTDLTSSRNNTEYTIITGKIPFFTRTWIGLFRDSWTWTDQTNISSVRWGIGCPNNAALNENCGFINNGWVDDGTCSAALPFFCYREITGQQQIVRMKIETDQNGIDPAATLKQIQQKLEALGVQNVTVKLKVQPGGLVFHKLEENNATVPNITNKPSCF